MEPHPFVVRQTDNLHRGRISVSGARYFATMVTQGRKPWLAAAQGRMLMLAAMRSWHDARHGRILAATVMPDHVHVLFELGEQLTVGQTIARWKTEVRKKLDYAEDFQRDFWEHMLRENEEMEDYALYIFLNPYRGGLLAGAKLWSGWWAPEPGMFRFTRALDRDGTPPREWINWPDARFAGLAHGE